MVGFWVFIVSNVLWVVWGWHDHAYALIALQVALAALNIRGVLKNEPEDAAATPARRAERSPRRRRGSRIGSDQPRRASAASPPCPRQLPPKTA